jgi:hypothetical protein
MLAGDITEHTHTPHLIFSGKKTAMYLALAFLPFPCL